MPSTTDELAHDFTPLIRVYKDGRVERLSGTETVPPSTNPKTGVQSKDIKIDPNTALSARLYLPKITNPTQKLPLIVYFHGGCFCVESAFSPPYHNYADSLSAAANAVVLSVNYRKAPEHPLPIAYNDSWAAIQWVGSHSTYAGPDVWLNDYVDFNRVFFAVLSAGDSAGANITHNMGIRAGSHWMNRVKLVGIVLIHPFFLDYQPIEKCVFDLHGMWLFVCPSSDGFDDPLINPDVDPKLSGMGCEKVLVCVAEKEMLRDRIWGYYEQLGNSGWGGVVEIMEVQGEDHLFHLSNPSCDNAVAMLKKVVAFINGE